jgi:hypothetical protein
MHVVLLRDLKKDAVSLVNGVFRFLDLEPLAAELDAPGRKNPTHRPRSPRLQRLLSKALFQRNERLYYRIARMASHSEPGYPPMNSALRSELERFYAPHNEALAELTGLDLSHWKPGS